MNLITKLQNAADVPTPAAGYGATFIDATDNRPKVKLSDGSIVDLRGIQGDTGVSANKNSVSIGFASGAIQTKTIADPKVSPTNPPTGLTVLTGNTTWELGYSVNLLSVSTGSFVVSIQAIDPDGSPLTGISLPSVTLFYLT